MLVLVIDTYQNIDNNAQVISAINGSRCMLIICVILKYAYLRNSNGWKSLWEMNSSSNNPETFYLTPNIFDKYLKLSCAPFSSLNPSKMES